MKMGFILLFLSALQACGGGDGENSNPIGLFGEVDANASLVLPEDGSVQNAMGLFNMYIGVAGVSTTLVSVSKAISMSAAPSCEQTDSHHVTCNTGLQGPAGGGVEYLLSFNCEDTSSGGRCDIPLVLQFGNFAYQNNCAHSLEASGVFRCQLTQVMEATGESQVVSRYSGQCNTQDSSNQENQMILNVDGKQNRVGFDLGVQFEERIRLNEEGGPALEQMDLNGVVSVNGVNYSFETLKNMGPSLCP